MRRKVFTLCSAVSLLLCVALIALRIRGHWMHDDFLSGELARSGTVEVTEARWHIILSRGSVTWARGTDRNTYASADQASQAYARAEEFGFRFPLRRSSTLVNAPGPPWPPAWGPVRWWQFGFAFKRTDLRQPSPPGRPGRREATVAVLTPIWPAIALAAGPPAAWAAGWFRRSRRRRAGLCSSCGYDLRATPGRCPECGAAGTTPASPS